MLLDIVYDATSQEMIILLLLVMKMYLNEWKIRQVIVNNCLYSFWSNIVVSRQPIYNSIGKEVVIICTHHIYWKRIK